MDIEELNEESEQVTVKDAVVIGVGTLLFIAGSGVIARIGWDAAGEGKLWLKKKLEARKNPQTK